MRLLESLYNNGLDLWGRAQSSGQAESTPDAGKLPGELCRQEIHRPHIDGVPLDESAGSLGIGRSSTFPLPQWRSNDLYHTVYFDEGQGRTLVFIHGLGGNATNWELTAPNLVDRYRVVGLDLVGCGWSRKPDVNYTVEFLRDHLLGFLERRRIHRATLVGHSLGGAVAMAAALKKPDLVESLVLMCAAGMAPLPMWMRLGSHAILNPKILFLFLIGGANFIVNNVFVDREDENRHVRWFREMSMRDDPGFPNLKDFARVGSHLCRDAVKTDFSGKLPSIDVPVLVLLGDHDKLTSQSIVLRSLDKIPRVRTVILSRCGHLPMVERPEETLFHLERFLTKPP